VLLFFFLQTECQNRKDEDGANSDDLKAEQDEMVIKYAGDIVPNLGKAITPDAFANDFRQLLPLFVDRMVRLLLLVLYRLYIKEM
jgi:hypothetical protein